MAEVTTRAVAHQDVKWREVYGTVVASASQSLRRGTVGISTAKASIIELLSIEPADGGPKPWQAFIIRNGDGALLIDTTANPLKSFREFIEAPPLRGLGESVADIERLLADEPEALARLREELADKPGSRAGGNNPHGIGGKSGKKRIDENDNIIINNQTDLFTAPPEKPKRQKKTDQGTRKDYTLARLKKNAPELFDQVKAGALSANAAALQAGFRRPMKSIPVDTPDNAITALLRVFSADELRAALDAAA